MNGTAQNGTAYDYEYLFGRADNEAFGGDRERIEETIAERQRWLRVVSCNICLNISYYGNLDSLNSTLVQLTCPAYA